MKTGLSVAALALAGFSLLAGAPAQADPYGSGYGPSGGIGFSYQTGGYCDSDGCPTDFWDYPIAYCPVYFDGEWYKGPFYYRYIDGDYYYWIRGDWRRDEWDGDRPGDACVDRFGPPEDYDFYASNGFIWLDTWRFNFFRHHHHHHDHDHDHDHDGGHDHDHDGDHHGGHGSWDHGGDHGTVWDHSGDHNHQPSSGEQGGAATGGPAPLGGSIGGGGPRDHFDGGKPGERHHDDGAAGPRGNLGTDRGDHHFGAAIGPSSPPPSPPPPPPPPPSSSPAPGGGGTHSDHHDFGDGGHHGRTP